MRGGYPYSYIRDITGIRVFPTHVGVTRYVAPPPPPASPFSPHTWGLPGGSRSSFRACLVFPTYVGVAHTVSALCLPSALFSPHAWGLPYRRPRPHPRACCFPHMRGGCSTIRELERVKADVFPTYVGVVRHVVF